MKITSIKITYGRSLHCEYSNNQSCVFPYPLTSAVLRGRLRDYAILAQQWMNENGEPPKAEDLPQTEEETKQRVAKVWEERFAIETDPMYGLSPVGAVIVAQKAAEGDEKAIAIQDWLQGLYETAVQREIDVLEGIELEPWPEPKEKPFSVGELLT